MISRTGSGIRARARRRQNLIYLSEQFDGANWDKSSGGISISADATAAPNGAGTADNMMEVANASGHSTYEPNYAGYTPGPYTFSVYVKPIGRQYFRIGINDGTNHRCYFDLAAGTVLSALVGAVGGIIALPDGWFRVWVSYTVPTAAAGSVTIHGALADGGVDTYAGDPTKGYALWGAQLNRGPLAPYAKTVIQLVQ